MALHQGGRRVHHGLTLNESSSGKSGDGAGNGERLHLDSILFLGSSDRNCEEDGEREQHQQRGTSTMISFVDTSKLTAEQRDAMQGMKMVADREEQAARRAFRFGKLPLRSTFPSKIRHPFAWAKQGTEHDCAHSMSYGSHVCSISSGH